LLRAFEPTDQLGATSFSIAPAAGLRLRITFVRTSLNPAIFFIDGIFAISFISGALAIEVTGPLDGIGINVGAAFSGAFIAAILLGTMGELADVLTGGFTPIVATAPVPPIGGSLGIAEIDGLGAFAANGLNGIVANLLKGGIRDILNYSVSRPALMKPSRSSGSNNPKFRHVIILP
jgi:hypothetical protein